MSATYEVRGDVAVITMNNPPVNGLGYETRRGIVDGLDKALADDAVKAIVVTGAGKAFSGGADIREFGSPKAIADPNLLSVILALEASTKPIVAAVHTVAMGGGLELALGCHYRVAAPGTQVALPEVKIGLIPGAGGTQRLPRVLGVETALNMIVSGEPVKSELLAKQPGQKLFDKIADGDIVDAAIAYAHEKVAARPLPLVRDLKVDYPNADAYFEFARNTVGAMSKNFPAPLKCVDAVAASTKMKFDDGMKFEREIFMALLITPEARALRHVFMAERAASKIADVPADTPLREIRKVAVIGAGTMGGGIAMNFLNAGIPVVMLEMKQEALDKGTGVMRKNYEAQVKKGKLKQDKLDERMGLLSTTLKYDDLKDADLVIEAVFEDMGVKEQVFKTLDEVMKPGAILASNTSTLDVNKIASFTKRPQDVVGMHFFSPANVMKLLEVVRGEKTGEGRARHGDGARQEDQEDLRRLRRHRRLHRQPDDRAVLAPGRLPARRRRHAGSRSTRRWRSSAWRWGRFAWATSPATTSAGTSGSAAMSRSPTSATRRPPTCSARWAASDRRPAPAGTTTCPASATRSRARSSSR